MIRELFGDKAFYKSLVMLALPIALQNLVTSSLNLMDNVMIGWLGETQLAAVALANQIYFLMALAIFGVSSGSAIFTAQFWGKKDVLNIRRVLGLNLLCGGSVAVLFTAASFSAPRFLLGIFSSDAAVVELGSSFLTIVCWSYLPTAVSFCFAFTLRSTGNTRLPMTASIIALAINTVLNYVLIFGLFSFPKLGVPGSALATLIARITEVTIILSSVYLKRMVPAASIRELLDIKLDFARRFFKTTLPVIANEILWSSGFTLYSVAYAHMGTGMVASINMSSTVERLAMVLFTGIASACAIMVGNKIGEGDNCTAYLYAKRLTVLGVGLGACMGLAVIFLSGEILSAYRVSYGVFHDARLVLIIFGSIMIFKIFNVINVVGILRSGGDTRFSLVLDTAGVWLIGVPLAFIGGLVWSLPIYIVYALVNLEELVKFAFGLRRFISRRWINNLVEHECH